MHGCNSFVWSFCFVLVTDHLQSYDVVVDCVFVVCLHDCDVTVLAAVDVFSCLSLANVNINLRTLNYL